MKYARLALLVVITAAATLLLVEAALLVRDVRRDIPPTITHINVALDEIHSIQVDTTRTEVEMAGLLNATRHSLITPAQSAQLLARTNRLIDDADVAAIKFGNAAADLGDVGPGITADLHKLTGEVEPVLIGVAADVNDPNIHTSIDALAQSSLNLADTTDQADATITKVRQGVDYEVNKLMTPAKKLTIAVKFLASVLGNLFHL